VRNVLVIVAAILTAAPLAAALGPAIPVTAPALTVAGHATAEAIAGNGDGFLVVWFEGRAERLLVGATRLTVSGQSLDPTGILLDSDATAHAPAVVWSGTCWIVAWSSKAAVVAQRVAPDGTLLDRTPRLLIAGDQHDVSMVIPGARIVIAASKIVSTDLQLDDARLIPTRDDGELSDAWAAASDGTNLFLAATLNAQRFGALLHLFILGGREFFIVRSSWVTSVHATYSGGVYWVSWLEGFDGQTAYVVRIDPHEQTAAAPSLAGGASSRMFPLRGGVVFTSESVIAEYGTQTMLCGSEQGHMTAGPVGMNRQDVAPRRVSEQDSPVGDPSGGSSLVAWCEDDQIFVRDLFKDDDPIRVTSGAAHIAPTLAGGHGSSLMACRTYAGGVTAILLPDGGASVTIDLPTRSTYPFDAPPAVLSNGDVYFVFWCDWHQLKMARITNGGVLLDKEPVAIVDYGIGNLLRAVAAVRGRDRSLLVWERRDYSSECDFPFTLALSPCRVYGMHLDSLANALEQPTLFNRSSAFPGATRPAVTWNGREFVVVWSAACAFTPTGYERQPCTSHDLDGVHVIDSGELVAFDFDGGSHPTAAGPVLATMAEAIPGRKTVIVHDGHDTQTFDIALVRDNAPRLVPMPEGAIAILYTDVREEEGFMPRAFLRWVKQPARGRPMAR
jgi:hypothetical protein